MKSLYLRVVAASLLTLFVILSAWYFFYYKPSHALVSREWMEYSMRVVKDHKPSPPAAARFYAYVSSVYSDVLVKTDSQYQASLAAAQIIDTFYPDVSINTFEKLETLELKSEKGLTEESRKILNVYKKRLAEDFSRQKVKPIPTGVEYWVGVDPLETSAGSWQRWFTDGVDFKVPPPPVFQSVEYKEALVLVRKQMDLEFSKQQKDAITFWGGSPGTETPAGIWQNRLFTVTSKYSLSDKEYAYAQMVLAQGLADAFMECWKVKYMYWTKRPSMVDKSIVLVWMPNPNFPSYISGHATISFAAAGILASLFPEYEQTWLANAEEAKNSRLWAAIHFPYDLVVGQRVGQKIGEVFIKKLNLKGIR